MFYFICIFAYAYLKSCVKFCCVINNVVFRYIEAIRRLKSEGRRFPRTVHLMFVPGENMSFFFQLALENFNVQ